MVKSNRTWILAAVVISIAIVAAGWILGIQPQLDTVSRASSEATNINDQNQLAELELARLKAQQEELPQLEGELKDLQASIPQRALLDEYTVALFSLAAENGVTLVSVDYAGASTFAPTTAFAELVPATVNPETFITIPYSISLSGSRENLESFLRAVQLGKRLTIIGGSSLAESPDASVWGMDFTGTVFVLLGPDGIQEGALQAPADPVTPTPDTSSPTPSPNP
ncbi:MAG: hypothetical protein ACOH1J_04620 [Microbacteriaceae bacterium]